MRVLATTATLDENQRFLVCGLALCLLPPAPNLTGKRLNDFLATVADDDEEVTTADGEVAIKRELRLLHKLKEQAPSMSEEDWSTTFAQLILVHLRMASESKARPLLIFLTDDLDNREKIIESFAARILIDGPEVPYHLLQDLIFLSLRTGCYDARARTLLRRLCQAFNLPFLIAQAAEENAIESIIEQSQESDEQRDERLAKEKRAKHKRWALYTLGAVAGGTVIGLTAGLAAPAIAAGAGVVLGSSSGAFLATTGGVALISTIFGTTGASLTSYALHKRVGDLKEFRFVAVRAEERGMDVVIGVNGWIKRKKIETEEEQKMVKALEEAARKAEKEQKKDQPIEAVAFDADSFSDSAKAAAVAAVAVDAGNPQAESEAVAVPTDVPVESKGAVPTESKTQAKKRKTLEREEADDELVRRVWNHSATLERLTNSGEVFTIVYDSDLMSKIGTAFYMLVGNAALSQAASKALAATALSGLLTAIAWPLTLIGLSPIIDNTWSNALSRADHAGRALANVLLTRVQGHRPVTLVGYGLGARAVFACLLEMQSRSRNSGIVERVVLMGCPVVLDQKQWERASRVVAGQFVNAYSEKDWLCRFAFRTVLLTRSIAGLSPAPTVNGRIVNVNVTDIVKGHLQYEPMVDAVLERCGFVLQNESRGAKKGEEESATEGHTETEKEKGETETTETEEDSQTEKGETKTTGTEEDSQTEKGETETTGTEEDSQTEKGETETTGTEEDSQTEKDEIETTETEEKSTTESDE